MTDQNDVTTVASDQPSELDILKKRATLMEISFHPNIGLENLKQRVDAKLNSTGAELPTEEIDKEKITNKPDAVINKSVQAETPKVAPAELRQKATMSRKQEKAFVIDQQRKAANKLIRVRVSCMNVNKKEHQGEIFTVSNSVVGTIKKYVPFNAENGWHVPQMILTMMQERKCQVFYNAKDHRGRKIKKGKLINEFAIEVLPPLTQLELKDLAKQQALAGNISD